MVLRYSAETKLTPAQLMARAEEFFTQRVSGLKVTDRGDCGIYLESSFGFVTIEDCMKKGKRTVLEIVTREYDYEVKDFLISLGRKTKAD